MGFIVGVMAIAIAWLGWIPAHTSPAQSEEVRTYPAAVERMKAGEGYYQAMASSLVTPPSQVRSMRLPTIFLLWRVIGLSWPLTLGVIFVSGYLVARLTTPLLGMFAVLWLVLTGYSLVNEQWTEVEFWALPLVLGSMLAIRRDRWNVAVVLMIFAACIRELAAPCLVTGAIAAWRAERPVRPWILAAAVWIAFYGLHTALATPWLTQGGEEFPLVGTGEFRGFLALSGAGLGVIGPIIVGFAVWRSRFRPEWWLVLPLVVGIPLAGFLIWRLYWSILCFPVALGLLGSSAYQPDKSLARSTNDVGYSGQPPAME